MLKMMKKRRTLLYCLWLALPNLSPAEVFQWIDPQGRTHYSDQAHENAKVLELTPSTVYYAVEKVYDGDTILLSNGQKVRFLGINTPEVAGRNKAAEVGGEAAKIWLKNKLDHRKVALQGDVEKLDKYQRRLAYVFTENKEHINLELVKQGLATVNIYPPNLKHLDELLAAQRQAEQEKRGLWAEAAYAAVPFQAINTENYPGWKRVTGRISDVKRTPKRCYLPFSDTLSIAIDAESWPLFPAMENYRGKHVEVRGWLHRSKDRLTILVRHPADIIVRD